MSGPVDHVVTSGTFSLDSGTWDVDNNVWIVGDENEVIVIDAAHDVEKIAPVIGDRRVLAVVCTHAHDDHVNCAPAHMFQGRARRDMAVVLVVRHDRSASGCSPCPATRSSAPGTATAPLSVRRPLHLGQWVTSGH